MTGSSSDRGLLNAFLEAHGAGDLEGHFRGIDRVVGAVKESNLHVHDGVAGQYAVLHRFHDALFDGWDIFPRDRVPHNLVDELEPSSSVKRGVPS